MRYLTCGSVRLNLNNEDNYIYFSGICFRAQVGSNDFLVDTLLQVNMDSGFVAQMNQGLEPKVHSNVCAPKLSRRGSVWAPPQPVCEVRAL